jgi:hypothetical protein
MIDAGHLADNSIPPPVHVESVLADRKSYAPHEGLRLPVFSVLHDRHERLILRRYGPSF